MAMPAPKPLGMCAVPLIWSFVAGLALLLNEEMPLFDDDACAVVGVGESTLERTARSTRAAWRASEE